MPEAGADVFVTSIGNPFINDQRQILYRLKFDGPSIDESNQYGIYFGPYDDPKLILRDGDSADYFPSDSVLHCVSWIEATLAMNDEGDFASMCEVEGAGREASNVLWTWRGLTGKFVPLLEVGSVIDGRTVTTDLYGQLGWYDWMSGGADGEAQSFNDRRELAVKLDFTDGTRGVYRIGPPLLGDTDGDGDVTASELAAFEDCATGPGADRRGGCAALDLDLDADIDLADFRALQVFVGEPR